MILQRPNTALPLEEYLNLFLESVIEAGIELYDHQEEAILEIFEGHNLILNTPTGSGKSLVALAHHFKSFCQGHISYYTVPIKALANEKFLSLCNTFGPENVGMITGDATINPSAPILCCTAEILSNLALRDGDTAKVHDVIIDEFHYYSDDERGIAWQIPLLTLPQARFTLMSATMGDIELFQQRLTDLTGTETTIVQSEQRPVPLEFQYSEIPLSEKVAELVESDKAPVYLVHFSQRAAADSAQNLLSSNICSKEEKKAIALALRDANFKSPYGKEINKLIRHGVGIHHAGLLPKYRILIEKLTQQGLLKVICGTDTLGVGVNVPIRSVLFTQLFKYDGSGVHILTVRDFKQIAGRAGRRGFDTRGYVVAQAPEHHIENLKLEQKAAASTKKKKWVKKKPPEHGFVNWTQDTFLKLQTSPSEPLKSSFKMRHHLILNILSRNYENGCDSLKKLLLECHESESAKKKLRGQARAMFISLVRGKVLSIIPLKDRADSPAKVQLNVELQEDFTMNQALGLYLLDTIPQLDQSSHEYSLQVLSLIEAILEDPGAIIKAQVNKAKSELVAELKEEGISYEDRMDRLEEVEHPKPGKDFIYTTYNAFRELHPWIRSEGVKPKSIAREMFEDYMDFEDYIKQYKLERSEAVLLRHLSEVFKVLSQSVPPHLKDENLLEAEVYLKNHVTSVDSSLIDEWELLQNPNYLVEKEAQQKEIAQVPLSKRKKKLQQLIKEASLQALKLLAYDDIDSFLKLFEPLDSEGQAWNITRIDPLIDIYFDSHHKIRLDPDARNQKHSILKQDYAPNLWHMTQIICDTEDKNDWIFSFTIDLKKSDAQQVPVLTLQHLSEA